MLKIEFGGERLEAVIEGYLGVIAIMQAWDNRGLEEGGGGGTVVISGSARKTTMILAGVSTRMVCPPPVMGAGLEEFSAGHVELEIFIRHMDIEWRYQTTNVR